MSTTPQNPDAPGPSLVGELVHVAVEAAEGAAAVVRSRAGTVLERLTTKSSPTDFVSEVDRASEEFIAAFLRQHRPHDALQAEEGTLLPGGSGITWSADPLDGTTNFVFGVPAYAVSLAAMHNGRPVAGAVVDCNRDETWSAGLGQGAWLGQHPCHVASGRSQVATALVSTGFGYRAEARALQGAVLSRLLGQVRDVRRFGSAALDLCWVACGRYDAYYESGLSTWDWAAGRLLCQEAGGKVGELGCGPLLATTPELWDGLSRLLEEAHGASSRAPVA